ncbi:nitroreductase [Bordetella genomosp. 5]|uniref:Nitroreductase n=1 Tax=Bordetella genomosp. 5 TaxID=1395608 RepID=A0A261TZQ0_9BORD|nr:nitroreductase [Bordetella genomosp. 5]OZI33762.1 nitroreductase [Bordetella genomosp. 5]OZI55099.1 nitroreductase [Bordetella genomosp. 5]
MNDRAANRPDALLESLLTQRHSCRAFRPEPVPREVIERLLTLAQRTASWCNCQPWRVTIASGAARDRLRDALLARATAGGEFNPDFPFPAQYRDEYLARRRESGFQLYGAVGVPRGDREAYRRQELRNFALFDAPHVAVITSDAELGVYGAIDCGAYVADFLLAAQALGVATVPQASLAMYPELLREQLDLPATHKVVCAISFGFEDETHPANQYRTHRAELGELVSWREA